MSGTGGTTSRWRRARRRLGILLAVLVVTVPIPVGLVLAWQVHWLLVVPAYLLGIPVWLSLVSGAWALVRRVVPAAEPVVREVLGTEPAVPPIRSEVRMPAPRLPGSAEGSTLSSPTP